MSKVYRQEVAAAVLVDIVRPALRDGLCAHQGRPDAEGRAGYVADRAAGNDALDLLQRRVRAALDAHDGTTADAAVSGGRQLRQLLHLSVAGAERPLDKDLLPVVQRRPRQRIVLADLHRHEHEVHAVVARQVLGAAVRPDRGRQFVELGRAPGRLDRRVGQRDNLVLVGEAPQRRQVGTGRPGSGAGKVLHGGEANDADSNGGGHVFSSCSSCPFRKREADVDVKNAWKVKQCRDD